MRRAACTVRLLGLDVGHPFVAAVTFTPYVAATAWLPVVAALGLRRRGVALVGVAAASILAAAVEAVLRRAREQDVDVLSLQELTPDAATRLDAAGGRGVFPGRAVEARPGAAGSGLYARLPLGARSPDDATDAEQPEAELRLPGARPVRIKAVHRRPPISARSERAWRRSIARLPRPGSEPRGPLRLIAGDFNATLDHGALRDLLSDRYVDAADATGNGLLSTWSNGLTGPPITIDHVLLDERLGVRSFSVHEVPGSDHRAIVTELVLPRG